MFNANKPDSSELPSTGRLLKSTGIAVVIASALLVTVVLPAEYGVDPTRAGSLLGLTEMGRIKMQLAAEAKAEEASVQPAPVAPAAVVAAPAAGVASETVLGVRTDETVLTLAPDQGAEIKLVMEEGARVAFTWTSSGGAVNFDTHADRPGTPYHGYGKGTEQRVEGELVAAFTGSHGWFWRNRTGEPVTITLRTTGAYSEVKRVV
ncbi:MAG: transmembrane anchor protein [Alphaproteobacteria bacterium]|nr:transmembrane anchor protein [Rhizobiaceae bacterium]MBU4040835.1 transmembrane anchor protein [Alphaproteobacteria bacterium]MBU4137833.1 transmembrane anchor protein [Alphaproteobacteria bacterium]